MMNVKLNDKWKKNINKTKNRLNIKYFYRFVVKRRKNRFSKLNH